MLDPLTGPGLDTLSLAPATTQQHAAQVRQARQHLDDLTAHPDAVDFDAARLSDASGATVSAWVDSRQGLSAAVGGTDGTPEMERSAPEVNGWPAVRYADDDEYHETPATIDWSAYDEATILGVHYTESVSGVSRGMSLAAGASSIATDGGVGTYRVDGNITGLHRADGEPFFLERDATADESLAVTVVTHDFAAKTPSAEIEMFVNGIEEEGSTTGTSNAGAVWQANLRARLGAENTSGDSGLDGLLARFIALPAALDGLAASRVLLLAYGLT